jgi:hypothetical protein
MGPRGGMAGRVRRAGGDGPGEAGRGQEEASRGRRAGGGGPGDARKPERRVISQRCPLALPK